jgi:tRNA(adenine34) deaminase
MQENDEFWMREAIKQAELARLENEVPIGAVLVKNNQLIAAGFNRPIALHDPTAHAEICVLREAGKLLGNYRLLDCVLYTSCEPCAMCAAAMVHARIKRVVFAALDPKAGALVSQMQFFDLPFLNHRIAWQASVLQDEASTILREFFKSRR